MVKIKWQGSKGVVQNGHILFFSHLDPRLVDSSTLFIKCVPEVC